MAESITLTSFVGRYGTKPDAVSRALRLESIPDPTQLTLEDYSGLIANARASYERFDYYGTIAIVDSVIKDCATRPLRRPSSRRDGDHDHDRAILVREALQLFERASSWLGIRYLFDGQHHNRGLEILSDIDTIDDLLGRSRAHASKAFRQQKLGRYEEARVTIEAAIAQPGEALSSVRALTDAKASLALRLGFYESAVELFRAVSVFDDSVSISTESQALAIGFGGISMLFASKKASGHGLTDALLAARSCELVGHLRFAAQIRRGLRDQFVAIGDFDAALDVIGTAPATGEAATFVGPESARLLLEALQVSFRSRRGPVAAEELLVERLTSVRVIATQASSAASDLLMRALRALVCGDLLGARFWTAFAAEAVTAELLEDRGVKTKRLNLETKNRLLFLAGRYGHVEMNALDDLRILRNDLAHGRVDGNRSHHVSQVCDVWRVLESLFGLAASIEVARGAVVPDLNEWHRFFQR